MNSLREWEEAFEQAVDVKKSYDLAKRMEEPKTNPVLGYRTAGSKAEWETGELLLKEMQEMGLQNVQKDKIKVDSWDFHHAVLRYRDKEGKEYEINLIVDGDVCVLYVDGVALGARMCEHPGNSVELYICDGSVQAEDIVLYEIS